MRPYAILSLYLLSLAACGGSPTGSSGDEQDVVSNGGQAFFVATGPGLTGGVSLRALNADATRCADGKKASACTVVGADFSALKLTDAQTRELSASFTQGKVIAKGQLSSQTLGEPSGITVAKLVVSEAWVGQTGTALRENDSVFLVTRIVDAPACTGACVKFHQATVNTSKALGIGKLDLGAIHVDTARLDDLDADLLAEKGALIAGVDHSLGGQGPQAPTLFADEIYLHAGALTGQACSEDVAIQARCAPGLDCVFQQAGGPISEHTPGVCNRVGR
jgi:Domain of unknown function (DUF6748)